MYESCRTVNEVTALICWMAHTTPKHTNKMALISPFPPAFLANKITQLLIGNSHIRIYNNLSEKRLPFNLIDRFCLTAMRPEYDSFTF